MKTNRFKIFAVLVVMLFALFMFGCSSGEKQSTDNSADSGQQQTDNGSNQSAKVEIPKKVLTVGGGSAGSLYVNFTAAWSDAVMKAWDGLNMTVVPGGSSQNLQGIDNGDMDFGISATLQVYPGMYGIGWAKGEKYDHANSLFPAYSYEGIWFTTADKDINSIYDLEGKKVALGYAGGGSDFTGREVLEFYGIKPSEIVNASWTDVGGMVRDGLVDAVFYLAGHPAGFIQELEVSKDLKFIPISNEDMKSFQKEKPQYVIGKVPAGTYKGLKEDYEAFQGWNYIMVSPDLPEDFVYELTKVTWENIDEIQSAHNSFKNSALENVQYMNLPLHPGAQKYYEEQGVTLPSVPAPPKN